MFYGLALCASLFALFTKARLVVYKLRKRRADNSGLMSLVFNADVGERLDVHRQRMTRALLYLLLAVSEVCSSLLWTGTRQLPSVGLTCCALNGRTCRVPF
jgi:hypothetical protein